MAPTLSEIKNQMALVHELEQAVEDALANAKAVSDEYEFQLETAKAMMREFEDAHTHLEEPGAESGD